jgi:antitoxin (DNA-binding transcriptional repressor) of toxin-antitoxin stability system
MKIVPAGKFKAQCLALIDDVHDHGEEVLITKRGKLMARLVAVENKKPESIFGFLKGRVRTVGDIVSPIVEPREWDEELFLPGTPEREEHEQKKTKPRRRSK